MYEKKTIPFFKIIAALCLGIVCIVEIKTMVDFADNYRFMAQGINAEYLTIVYYIMGFSFLAIAFSAILVSGKKRYSIIAASVEFLLILGASYYLKEYFEPGENMDEITFTLILIPILYVDEHVLVLLLSVAALIFSILDITLGDMLSAAFRENSCIYCGRRLRYGEKCTCDLDDSYVINDFDTDPAHYADDVEKHQCPFCRRILYGDEMCSCPGAKRTRAEDARREEYTRYDTAATDSRADDTLSHTPPADETKGRKGFINKEFITKPGTGDSKGSPATDKKTSESKYFSVPDDL